MQILVRKVDFLTAALMQNTDALQKMVCTATEPAHRACNRACTTTEPAAEPCIDTEPPTEPASADKREAEREGGRETKILIPQVVLEHGKSQYTIQLHEAAHCVRSEMDGSLKNRKASSLKAAQKPFTVAEIPAPPSNSKSPDFLGNSRQGSASKQLVHVSSKQLVDACACDVRQEKPSRVTSQAKATRKHRSLTLTPRSGPLTPTPRSVCQALDQVAESERPVRLTPLKNDVLVSTSETQPIWLEVLQSSAGKGDAPAGGEQREDCDATRRDPFRATMQKGAARASAMELARMYFGETTPRTPRFRHVVSTSAAQANWLSAGVAAGDGESLSMASTSGAQSNWLSAGDGESLSTPAKSMYFEGLSPGPAPNWFHQLDSIYNKTIK